MARKSSITALDARLKGAIDDAVREGRATIDQIVELVRGMGGEVSRSAVGRYKKGFEESLMRYREAQEVAGRWIAQFKADPESDVGRLLAEMCKTLAFQTMAAAGERDEAPDMLELARLARAVKALTDVDRVKAEVEAQVRGKVKADVDRALAKVEAEPEGKGRITAEALRRIREEVYGVVG